MFVIRDDRVFMAGYLNLVPERHPTRTIYTKSL